PPVVTIPTAQAPKKDTNLIYSRQDISIEEMRALMPVYALERSSGITAKTAAA
ncbi:hypothetical protein EV182_006201, partial [Spiromyces aspiralis]